MPAVVVVVSVVVGMRFLQNNMHKRSHEENVADAASAIADAEEVKSTDVRFAQFSACARGVRALCASCVRLAETPFCSRAPGSSSSFHFVTTTILPAGPPSGGATGPCCVCMVLCNVN